MKIAKIEETIKLPSGVSASYDKTMHRLSVKGPKRRT